MSELLTNLAGTNTVLKDRVEGAGEHYNVSERVKDTLYRQNSDESSRIDRVIHEFKDLRRESETHATAQALSIAKRDLEAANQFHQLRELIAHEGRETRALLEVQDKTRIAVALADAKAEVQLLKMKNAAITS